MKIWQYLRFQMKIICSRSHIKISFTFWDMRTWDTWKFCLLTFRNNRICEKLAYFLRNLQTSRANISRILRIKNAEFSGYCLYMNTDIKGDFQICISVLLKRQLKSGSLNIAFAKSWFYLMFFSDVLDFFNIYVLVAKNFISFCIY